MSPGNPTRPSAVIPAMCLFTFALSRTTPPPKSVSIAPGAQRVDGNVAFAEFDGKVAREYFDPALHRCICRVARIAKARETTREIHDPAAVGDDRQQRLREKEHAFEMHAHELIELRFGRVGKRAPMPIPALFTRTLKRSTPQVAASVLLEARCEGGERGDVAGVERQRDGGLPAGDDRGHHLVGSGLLREIGDDDAVAGIGEAEGGSAAETAAACRSRRRCSCLWFRL